MDAVEGLRWRLSTPLVTLTLELAWLNVADGIAAATHLAPGHMRVAA